MSSQGGASNAFTKQAFQNHKGPSAFSAHVSIGMIVVQGVALPAVPVRTGAAVVTFGYASVIVDCRTSTSHQQFAVANEFIANECCALQDAGHR